MVEDRGFSRRRIAVLGAGPAGMTAAYLLSKDPRYEIFVYEAAAQVGGKARSLDLWGQKVDLGPQRCLSRDSRVNSIWQEIMGADFSRVRRKSSIYVGRQLFNYPPGFLELFRKVGVVELGLTLLSYLKQKFFYRKKRPANFEEWLIGRFGRRLYESFFKPYSEDAWGMSCAELDVDSVSQRFQLSLWKLLKQMLRSKLKGQDKVLAQEFSVPHGGSGELYERMARKFIHNGGRLYLSRPVKGLWTDGKQNVLGIEMIDGEFIGFDHVISSLPLSKIAASIKECPVTVKEAALQLNFRNTIHVYLEVEGAQLFSDHWIHFVDHEIQACRVTNYRNWLPELWASNPNTVLSLEYSCFDPDALWDFGDEHLIKLASSELRHSGLIRDHKIHRGEVVRLAKNLPVYKKGYKTQVAVIESYLQSLSGLQVIGRDSAFNYDYQENSILMGHLAAENILNDSRHNLWRHPGEGEGEASLYNVDDTGYRALKRAI